MSSTGFRAAVDDPTDIKVLPADAGFFAHVAVGDYGLDGTLLLTREAAEALVDGLIAVLTADEETQDGAPF